MSHIEPIEKFSVIIPTMWRELEVFNRALAAYIDHPLVDDIIIIDNDKTNSPDWEILNHPKVNLVKMESNIYVNPAWNLGVSLSKNDKLIIANDDIEFDVSLIDKIYPRIRPDMGAHGIVTGEEIFGHPPSTDYTISFKQWEPEVIIHSFGQLMFLHKSNWTPIIDGLQIYYGDDFIFLWHLYKGLNNYLIYNIKFYSPMASTTKDTSITGGKLEAEQPIYVDWALKHQPQSNVSLINEYLLAKDTPSDINQHVDTLKALCDQVNSVTEFGVRTGVSTRGILISGARKIRSYDLVLDPTVQLLFDHAGRNKDAAYIQADTLTVDIDQTDLLFIDTDHTYQQLKAELDRHHSKVNKYICFHDTHSYGVHVNDPVENPGLLPAIMEFMRDHPEWKVDYFTTNNNGFTVLKRDDNTNKAKKKILIAIPTNRYVETDTVKSIYDLTIPDGYETELQFFYGYQIDQIRNLIGEWAKHYDYLFSVDSDIVLPKDALVKMLAANKDIISGLYIQRKPGQHILEVYKVLPNGGMGNIAIEELQGLGIVEIAGCGFGCCLIKGDVFRTIPYPHFVYKSALDHKDTISEDIYFCMKAWEHKFTIWCDPSIVCDHVGSTKFVVQWPKKSHLEMVASVDLLPIPHANYLKTLDIKPKVIYDIGACVLHWTRKAKEVWGDAEYYLFDAASSVQPFLERSGHPYAISVLSDKDGKIVDFYEDVNNPGGNSYYLETTGAFTEQHKTRRITTTLDSITKQNNWPKPDLIKMDVQGAEMDVLRGAKKTLEKCTDIILECQHSNYNDGAPKFKEMCEFLNSIGFELVAEICTNENDGDYHFQKV